MNGILIFIVLIIYYIEQSFLFFMNCPLCLLSVFSVGLIMLFWFID